MNANLSHFKCTILLLICLFSSSELFAQKHSVVVVFKDSLNAFIEDVFVQTHNGQNSEFYTSNAKGEVELPLFQGPLAL